MREHGGRSNRGWVVGRAQQEGVLCIWFGVKIRLQKAINVNGYYEVQENHPVLLPVNLRSELDVPVHLIHLGKTAITFEPMLQFKNPSGFIMS